MVTRKIKSLMPETQWFSENIIEGKPSPMMLPLIGWAVVDYDDGEGDVVCGVMIDPETNETVICEEKDTHRRYMKREIMPTMPGGMSSIPIIGGRK